MGLLEVLTKLIKYSNRLAAKVNRLKRDRIIRNHAGETNDFFFVQIGANDGISSDPINKFVNSYGWSGVLVEPQEDVFQTLRKNYQHRTNLILENTAITDKDGYIDFYRSPDPSLSSAYPDDWFIGRNEGRALKNRTDLGGGALCRVRSMTFAALLDKHSIRKIDLLQIDAEGYDYEIIKQINFAKMAPLMICYEHHHLSRETQQECVAYLSKVGYKTFELGSDTFAFTTKSTVSAS